MALPHAVALVSALAPLPRRDLRSESRSSSKACGNTCASNGASASSSPDHKD